MVTAPFSTLSSSIVTTKVAGVPEKMNVTVCLQGGDQRRLATAGTGAVHDLSGWINVAIARKGSLGLANYTPHTYTTYPKMNDPSPAFRDNIDNPLDLLRKAVDISGDVSKPDNVPSSKDPFKKAASPDPLKKNIIISSGKSSRLPVDSQLVITPGSLPVGPSTSGNLPQTQLLPVRNIAASPSDASIRSIASLSSSPLQLEASAYNAKGTSRGKKDEKWMAVLKQLVEYKKENGSCLVPRGYSLNPRLASWIAEQRKQYKLFKDGRASSMTSERISLLNSLAFAWSAQQAAWGKHMADLIRFQTENGHCLVPLYCPKYPKLGLWVKEQRRHYSLLKQGKKSHMTEARIHELTDVGFTFDTHEAIFLKRLKELASYKEKFGDCLVPTNYEENTKLGTWCHHQRRQYKKWCQGKPCHITEDRIRALNNVDFVWNPRKRSLRHTEESQSDTSSIGNTSADDDKDLEGLDLRPHKRQKSL